MDTVETFLQRPDLTNEFKTAALKSENTRRLNLPEMCKAQQLPPPAPRPTIKQGMIHFNKSPPTKEITNEAQHADEDIKLLCRGYAKHIAKYNLPLEELEEFTALIEKLHEHLHRCIREDWEDLDVRIAERDPYDVDDIVNDIVQAHCRDKGNLQSPGNLLLPFSAPPENHLLLNPSGEASDLETFGVLPSCDRG
ncbi:MAG: hypothetical protein LQ341_007398 [Variospora aurantia]|nr:MAG: hypothetical protein LQ341_007398 [Variospora aurantia]